MKRKIKPLAVLSAALILAGSVPASTAFSATDEGSDTSHISQIVDPVVSNFYQYMLNDSGEAILLDYYGTAEDIVIPDEIDGHPVTELNGNLYRHKKNLKTLMIPEGIKTIHGVVCWNCPSLTTVYYNAPECEAENGFGACPALEDFIIGDNVKYISGGIIPGSIKYLTIPDSVTKIAPEAFQSRINLKSIIIPDSVTTIGESAFRYCSELEEIKIGSGVTEISDTMFSQLLSDINIPNQLREIGDRAFAGCGKLSSVTFPVTLESIGAGAFVNCMNLVKADLTENIKSIGIMAFFCTGISSVKIPQGITEISTQCFYGCTKLTEAYIPEGVTTIGGGAFARCKFTSLSLPESITTIHGNALSHSSATARSAPAPRCKPSIFRIPSPRSRTTPSRTTLP